MIFISAICHGQWYFTSYILQKIIYIFHNHVSQSAELSLSFKNDVKISRHYLSVPNSAGALDPQTNKDLDIFSALLNAWARRR